MVRDTNGTFYGAWGSLEGGCEVVRLAIRSSLTILLMYVGGLLTFQHTHPIIVFIKLSYVYAYVVMSFTS